MKTCTKCGKEYPATTAYFYKHKNGRGGLTPRCKKCLDPATKRYAKKNKDKYREYSKKYREENRDKTNAQSREYVKNNKDKRAITTKKYREKNKDKLLKYDRAWYNKNKERDKQKRIDKRLEYYSKNKEKLKKYYAWYRENNKDEIRERNKNRDKEHSKTLSDHYVAIILSQQTGMRFKDTAKCNELIELKITQLKLYRFIYNV